jgi:hypothetical protein
LRDVDGEVAFIPMSDDGVFVMYTSTALFKKRYPLWQRDPSSPKSLQGCTVERAARCYVTHATYSGADATAIAELEKLVPITKQEKEKITMAKKKESKPETDTNDKPRAAKKTSSKLKAMPEKKADKPKAEKTPRVSAAATFKELIMQGGLTDDQIFEGAKKKHPELTPDKRSYVAWYRNALRKAGENPPAPKKTLKED